MRRNSSYNIIFYMAVCKIRNDIEKPRNHSNSLKHTVNTSMCIRFLRETVMEWISENTLTTDTHRTTSIQPFQYSTHFTFCVNGNNGEWMYKCLQIAAMSNTLLISVDMMWLYLCAHIKRRRKHFVWKVHIRYGSYANKVRYKKKTNCKHFV